MAVVDVLNCKGDKVSEIDLVDSVFNVPVNVNVMHEVVRMQLAKRRSGSASVRRRGDVAGSTRKLFRQKGTGRARRGSIKSPLLRGGGVVFGPSPRSYGFSVPKKVRKLALRMALSSKYQSSCLVVLDKIDLERIKTKEFASIIKNLDRHNVLVITDQKNEILELSARNIPKVKVLRLEGLNVFDILKYKDIIMIEPAVRVVEGRLSE